MTPSRAYFSLPGDETRSGAQDLRRGLRHSARSNRPWSAPKDQGLSGTLASNGGEHRRLRRSAGTSALRAVRNASGEHLPDLRRQRLVGEDADLYHNGDMLSALGVSRREWMALEPIHEAQERDRKDRFSSSPSFRSNPIRTITGPMIRRQKSSRQFGVCGSALERAPVPHKTSRIRRSRSRRLKRPLAPARRSAAVCGGLGSRAKQEPNQADRDCQAIRRKGVVQGQSRQALMSLAEVLPI